MPQAFNKMSRRELLGGVGRAAAFGALAAAGGLLLWRTRGRNPEECINTSGPCVECRRLEYCGLPAGQAVRGFLELNRPPAAPQEVP